MAKRQNHDEFGDIEEKKPRRKRNLDKKPHKQRSSRDSGEIESSKRSSRRGRGENDPLMVPDEDFDEIGEFGDDFDDYDGYADYADIDISDLDR